MPAFERICEIALYSLLNFLPLMLFALYPFRRQLRFGLPGTALLALLLAAVQIRFGMEAAFGDFPKGLLSFTNTIVFFIFYFTAVKAPVGKVLFTLLMLSNLSNLLVTGAKCMEGLFFGAAAARQLYRWTNSLCLAFVTLLAAVPLLWYFRHYYADGITKQAGTSAWNYLWLIPATFTLLFFWHTYGSGKSPLETALIPSHALFLLFINLGAFLVYHTFIMLIRQLEANQTLIAQNHWLTIQNLQYKNFSDRLNEARQARHDIRHHIATLDSLLKAKEYGRLEAYLRSYQKSLPNDNEIQYCAHCSVNAILAYFARQAQDNGITFDVSVKLPAQINLPDHILSVLLGNLLENAIEACLAIRGRSPKISLNMKAETDTFFLEIENSSSQRSLRDKDGRFLSTKHKGHGVGLESVKSIVAHYDGLMETTEEENLFCVSLMLNIPC